ncbi:MAG: TRAP transporter small permease [Rhizobiaceae bacterium]|nr:TRAP transporter small permease [Rhizobiaceae bacterium]
MSAHGFPHAPNTLVISMTSKPTLFTDTIEETFIAVTLGLMTVITFANVVARYIFNSNILWGLEVTVFLFAWLVLIGCSYGVKKSFHIGVDVLVNSVPAGLKRIFTLLACIACLSFAVLLFIGAWNYWGPFAGVRPLPVLYNDLIASPLGLAEIEYRWRDQSFYETDDVPVPLINAWLSETFNYGERYEKLPRFIPYFALPLGMGLLLFRVLQASLRIFKGEQDLLIAGHEAEEMLEEAIAGDGEAK